MKNKKVNNKSNKKRKLKRKQNGGFISTIGKYKNMYDMYRHGRSIYDDTKKIVKTIKGKDKLAKKIGVTIESGKSINANIKGLKAANKRRKYWSS